MQHDGGDWRCLVAEALSRMSRLRFLGRESHALFFQPVCHHRFHPAIRTETCGLQLHRAGHWFPPLDAWRAWAECRNAPGTPKPSSRALLAQSLFATDDDFPHQYS